MIQRFKQKMTEATLLKGNSTSETIRVNYNATSVTRTTDI